MVNIERISNGAAIQASAAQKTAGTAEKSFSGVLQSQLQTSTSMEQIFQKAAKEYDLPLNLLKAVAKAESDFNPNSVSHCGAQGVMQLMPGTAASLGVKDAFDPQQNIMGGAKYLRQLMNMYDGDPKLTLAAYNAGMGNVRKYGGIPPFKETRNYVEKVMRYAGQDLGSIDTVVKTAEKAVEKTGIANQAPVVGAAVKSESSQEWQSKLLLDSTTNQNAKIYQEILEFQEYTKEDYQIFCEYLKFRMLSSIDRSYAFNPLSNPIQFF